MKFEHSSIANGQCNRGCMCDSLNGPCLSGSIWYNLLGELQYDNANGFL